MYYICNEEIEPTSGRFCVNPTDFPLIVEMLTNVLFGTRCGYGLHWTRVCRSENFKVNQFCIFYTFCTKCVMEQQISEFKHWHLAPISSPEGVASENRVCNTSGGIG